MDVYTGLAWLKSCPVLGVVVGLDTGGATIWVQSRAGDWCCAAFYSSSLPVTNVCCTSPGLPVLVAGTHLLILSNASIAAGNCCQLSDTAIGIGLEKSGSLRDYDPFQLRLFVATGDSITGAAVVRSLTVWLREQKEKECKNAENGSLLSPTVEMNSLVMKGITNSPCSWGDQSGNFVLKEPFSLLEMSAGLGQSLWNAGSADKTPSEVPRSAQSPISAAGTTSVFGNLSSISETAPSSGIDSGLLDMSAFAMGSFTKAPQISAVQTGGLDPSAFGFGGVGVGDSEDTGTLDPSAFGFGSPRGAGSSPQIASLVSGTLDPSSFGFGYHGPVEASQPTEDNGSIATGALDPSVFGGGGVSGASPQCAGSSDCVSSGTLDPMSFGFGNEGPVEASQPEQNNRPMATGTLDPSAFGFGTSGAVDSLQQQDHGAAIGTGSLTLDNYGTVGSMMASPRGQQGVKGEALARSLLDGHKDAEIGPTMLPVKENEEAVDLQCSIPVQCLPLTRGLLYGTQRTAPSNPQLLSSSELESFRDQIGWGEDIKGKMKQVFSLLCLLVIWIAGRPKAACN